MIIPVTCELLLTLPWAFLFFLDIHALLPCYLNYINRFNTCFLHDVGLLLNICINILTATLLPSQMLCWS